MYVLFNAWSIYRGNLLNLMDSLFIESLLFHDCLFQEKILVYYLTLILIVCNEIRQYSSDLDNDIFKYKQIDMNKGV